MHVGINAGFLLAFGAPVARRLGEDLPGVLRWILLLCGSIVGGSLAFLLFEPDFPGLVVGASGGTSGLMAAAVVSGHDRAWRGVFTRDFLVFTLIFAISNLILTLVGPALLGGGLAWQAHLGGYVAGAGLMAVLDRRRQEGFF
jgi:membrane associated rhomboid family serine protease